MADGYEKIVLLDKGVAKELNSSEEEVQRHFYKRLWQESEKTLGFSHVEEVNRQVYVWNGI